MFLYQFVQQIKGLHEGLSYNKCKIYTFVQNIKKVLLNLENKYEPIFFYFKYLHKFYWIQWSLINQLWISCYLFAVHCICIPLYFATSTIITFRAGLVWIFLMKYVILWSKYGPSVNRFVCPSVSWSGEFF